MSESPWDASWEDFEDDEDETLLCEGCYGRGCGLCLSTNPSVQRVIDIARENPNG